MLDANFSLFAAARRLFAVMSLISYYGYTFFSLPVFYFIDFFVVIPRQTIWHPFFCCETNPYLGLPCTPAFTMLALGMPEDWQPPRFIGDPLANSEPRLSLEHRQRLWAAEQHPDPTFRTLEDSESPGS